MAIGLTLENTNAQIVTLFGLIQSLGIQSIKEYWSKLRLDSLWES